MSNNQPPILIKNATIHTETEKYENASLYIANGIIQKLYVNDEVNVSDHIAVIDATNLQVIPGFIDIHIHGANGYDVMDATEEALDKIAFILPQEGVTSFLATTITQSSDNIERALENIANYKTKPMFAEILGVHLEGPFINKVKAGAQPEEFITPPSITTFAKWQDIAKGSIKTITLAPELDANGEFIHYLFENGVNISAGHTDASFGDIKSAVSLGVRQLTHLCNAMNGIHHRDVGAVGASFLLQELRSEIIADGVHITPEMLHIIYENIGSERLILITDSMRAKYLGEGEFDLGGQKVKVDKNQALLDDGTLAGSILKMCDAVNRMLKIKGVTIQDIIKMTASNPAKQLGLFDRKGSIEPGKDADLLIIDDVSNIRYTICRGEIAYKSNENL
ncbi:MAG TPA: N-acetylglucosamine-6-phosphate deacetylase [Ureibacillus sp.]|nr:N-acetylglucosamine-6-phosphate deacetylase [Ureibacillus sp.]